jgi:antitoxin (DNA-binding transcriptional repressor) of toxin-antitoxin stability system
MQILNLFDARTHFSRLIEQIASGAEDEFIIKRNGKPVAKVVPAQPADASSRIGIAKGKFVVPDDIDWHNDEVARRFNTAEK